MQAPDQPNLIRPNILAGIAGLMCAHRQIYHDKSQAWLKQSALGRAGVAPLIELKYSKYFFEI